MNRSLSIISMAFLVLNVLAMMPVNAGSLGTIVVSNSYICGNMVLQVTVSDPGLAAATIPMPSVTVNRQLKIVDNTVYQGYLLPMYQAVGGSWVGFIALETATVSSSVPAAASPQEGTKPTGGVYNAPWTSAISREPWGTATTLSQSDFNNIISYVQSPDASFTITYNDMDPVTSVSVTVEVDCSPPPPSPPSTQPTVPPSYNEQDLELEASYILDSEGVDVAYQFALANDLISTEIPHISPEIEAYEFLLEQYGAYLEDFPSIPGRIQLLQALGIKI